MIKTAYIDLLSIKYFTLTCDKWLKNKSAIWKKRGEIMTVIKTACMLILLFSSTAAFAGSAVSDINGKLDINHGSMESSDGTNATGSISLPLTDSIGFQADGLYTHVSSENFYGMGTHLFWRHSSTGLLGLVLAGVTSDDVYCLQGGLEGEYYWNRFTFGLQGGIAKIKYDGGSLPFMDTNETKGYAGALAGFYPIENLLMSVEYRYAFDNSLFKGNVEYQTPVDGLSAFAEFARGENDYDHNLFGLRYYFGKRKSLQQRHREDDPENITGTVLHSIGTYGAEMYRNMKKYVRRLPISIGQRLLIRWDDRLFVNDQYSYVEGRSIQYPGSVSVTIFDPGSGSSSGFSSSSGSVSNSATPPISPES